MKKLTLFLVAITMSLLSFAAQPKRIYAYGLSSTLVDKVYTFSFTANETPTSGKIIFYDATSSELVGEIALTNPVLGKNEVEIAEYNLPGADGQQLNWSVELSAAAVTAYEKVFADASHRYRRGYSNVDVSPESDHFGHVYVADRTSTKSNSKFYVYNPVYAISDANGHTLGADTWAFGRFTIASDGTVWLTDYSDGHSGLFLVDPDNLATATQFFAGTRASSGLFKNGSVEVGSSLSCASLYGKGADTKLVTVAEDYTGTSFPVAVFNVGQSDGTLATTWTTAPNILFNTLGNAAQIFDIKACEQGVWVATNRGTGANNSSATSLRFYTWDGTCTWSSHEHTDLINGSLGGSLAITPDEKQLIMKIQDNTIAIFDVTWSENTPTLTLNASFNCGYAAVSAINLDYAGNIVTIAGTAFSGTDTKRMSLVVYSNPTANNTCEVPAKKADVVTKVEPTVYTITAVANDENMGTVTGGDTYYAGESATLKATAKLGYVFAGWADGEKNATRIVEVSADATYTANFQAIAPRAWAYDLKVVEDGDNYKFTFNATTAGTATLLFADIDGNPVAPTSWDGGLVNAGDNTVLVEKAAFTENKDVYWSVKIDGEAIPAISEITDASKGIYNFYLPQGVAVDNNPESPTFSKIYIAESTDGAADGGSDRADNQKRGIFIYDQTLAELNPTSNEGIIPSNVTLGTTTRNALKRIAINPKTNEVAFAYNASPAAVWAVSTENVAGEATNLLAGLGFDYCNSLCFDENGILYIFDNGAGYPAKGSLYKIVNGEKITIFSENSKYGNADNSLASDGRGGLWIAQNRSKLDGFNQLAHVSASGVIDFEVNSTTTNGFASLETSRGAMAYNPREDILAIGIGASGTIGVSLYQVTYNPSTGVPSLEYIGATPSLGKNVEGIAFDYAGDLYALSANAERFYKFTLPTDENICTVPAPASQKLVLGTQCEVTVTVNDPAMGSVEGAGTYEKGAEVILTPKPVAHYRFVNWTGDMTSTDNPLKFTIEGSVNLIANFEAIPQVTITVTSNDENMGTVTGGGTYDEGQEVTIAATPKATYRFVKWSDDVTDATRTFPAAEELTLQAIFEKVPNRAWAYDLSQVADGDNYKFSFVATTAGEATLLFADKDGNELVAPYAVGTVAAGANTVTLAKTTFEGVTKDVYWSVKMDGEEITAVAEITDQTKGIYDFVDMTGVLVDNNPDSKYFGEVYVQMALNGTVGSKTQTAGLFIFDQTLAIKNTDANAGIQPILPSGYTMGDNRNKFHRLNINPNTGDLVYSYNIASSPAVFAIDRENMAGNVTNLVEGVTGLTHTNAHCFDENGTLYVMDNASYPNTGAIYKIVDGVAKQFVANANWANASITMASDGRGGLWVSQYRGQMDTYYQLTHVTSGGTIDWYVNSSSSQGLTGHSRRGALAYDVERQILAQGRDAKVELYSVEYDATTGVPTLTSLYTVADAANIGNDIDGLAFDYAGDLYVVNTTKKKFQKFTIPTDENICTVPAPESQVIQKETRYTVTVLANPAEGGTVSGGGDYPASAKVEVKATANIGYQFVNWTINGEEVSESASFEYEVPADNVTLTANFKLITYSLITSTNDESKGTVSVEGECTHGTEVTLTATPKAGYKLLYWSDRSTDNPRTITMTKNEAISAYFVKEYAEEPTFKIEKVWENTNVPASTDNGYQAAGWDGKIYMKDRLGAVINVYTETGSELYVESDALTAETDFRGDQAIAIDGVGNIIIRSGSGEFFNNPTQVTIYKNDEKTGRVIDFTLLATGRCDFISASGDIYSEEGGYVYFYCQNQTTVSRLYIKNGGASAADFSVDKLDNATLTAGSTQSHVFTNIFGNLMTHTRASVKVLQEVNVVTGAVTTMNLPNFKQSTLGGCSFELGGKELIAYNIAGTDYNSEWNLYNMTDKQFLSAETLYAKDKVSKNSAANWLNVQVVDENTAYIYQFCPTVGVAVWKVSIETPKYTREVTNGDYGTICLPYGSSDFTGAEFYEIAYLELEADGITPKGIWLDEVTELEVGKPYIFKATADELVVYYEGKEALSPVEGKAGLTGTFEGISDPNDILEGNYMINKNKFCLCGTGCWLNANRAYIDKNTLHNNTTPVAAIPGRRRVSMNAAGENTTTGIDNLTEGGAIAPNIEGTYDVLGRKMNEPNNTGFYIVNGKKVVIVK